MNELTPPERDSMEERKRRPGACSRLGSWEADFEVEIAVQATQEGSTPVEGRGGKWSEQKSRAPCRPKEGLG